MPLKPKQVRVMTGVGLAVATLLTRLPFVAKTLFEFDSIDFAVAVNRFSLSEVTPHMPGYILHVLLARFFYQFTHDLNEAFVALSVVLSIGAVLFLWRAGAQLRGERVGLMVAVIWLTTPLFWFHGEIASVYIHEAFFCSALLYFGLKLLARPVDFRLPTAVAITYALAIGARQSSVLFLLPAIVYVFYRVRLSGTRLWLAMAVFLLMSGLWLSELLRESGGISVYLEYLGREHIYRSQSVLFGSDVAAQMETIGKVLFYEPVSVAVLLLAAIAIVLAYPKRVALLVKQAWGTATFRFVGLVAVPALCFYLVIYFMKPGYLLTALPSEVLIGGVLLDQCAIWLAERIKRRPENKLRATRAIIVRYATVLTGVIVVLNVAWFVGAWPGTTRAQFNDEYTSTPLSRAGVGRVTGSRNRIETLANRAFEYTNIRSIENTDALNEELLSTLQQSSGSGKSLTLIATWWFRWAYLELAHATVYDVQADGPDKLAVGVSHEMLRRNLYDSTIVLDPSARTLILIRHDAPDFAGIAAHVHLRRLPTSEYLDVFEVMDSTFHFRWRDREFSSGR